MRQEGICKLTGERGAYVKSHIIPRAFTDKNLDKVGRIEAGQFGRRPTLKFTGWYDDQIVTRKGEDILSRYDSLATNEIRRLGLCWRFFPLVAPTEKFALGEFEIFKYDDVDTRSLQLFFLSVLWRAATSKRPEFKEIRLDIESARKLHRIVSGKVSPSPADFPATLTLLTTKGQPQNLTPLRQRMKIPQLVSGLPKDKKIFRFFFDGLIAHIGRKSADIKTMDVWGPRTVGVSKRLWVIGRSYEGSFQEENLGFLIDEVERDWPIEAEKIYGKL